MISVEKIKGNDLMVFVDSKSVAFATNHMLTLTINMVATTSKQSGGMYQTSRPQSIAWKVQTENLYSQEAVSDLMDIISAGTPVQIIFGKKSSSATTLDDETSDHWSPSADFDYLSGMALVDSITINAPVTDTASFSASFTGTGALSKITS